MIRRAWGAYIVTIYQPEVTFDYSITAKTQNPNNDDIDRLNKRIK